MNIYKADCLCEQCTYTHIHMHVCMYFMRRMHVCMYFMRRMNAYDAHINAYVYYERIRSRMCMCVRTNTRSPVCVCESCMSVCEYAYTPERV